MPLKQQNPEPLRRRRAKLQDMQPDEKQFIFPEKALVVESIVFERKKDTFEPCRVIEAPQDRTCLPIGSNCIFDITKICFRYDRKDTLSVGSKGKNRKKIKSPKVIPMILVRLKDQKRIFKVPLPKKWFNFSIFKRKKEDKFYIDLAKSGTAYRITQIVIVGDNKFLPASDNTLSCLEDGYLADTEGCGK